jgi:queuosine precursor transporter
MQTFNRFHIVSSLFIATLLVSNIIAVKIADIGGLFLPAAVLVFPVTYVLCDVLTEVYGFAATRRVIWMGFACNLLAALVIQLSIWLPAAPFYEASDAYASILGSTPRILTASFVAYLIGSFTNAVILAKLKVKTNGKHLWLRTISSTIIGEGLDSAIFISLAFWGIFEPAQVGMLILTQWLFKLAFEVVLTPVTYSVTGYLKRADKIDHFDRNTRFSPF